MNFVALDFETANANLSSICQAGIVTFKDGQVVETFSSLIDPRCRFDGMNVSIHGINAAAVEDAPCFREIYPEILQRTQDAVVVCHTTFDRAALQRATAAHDLACTSCQWLDTTRVVRRTWPQYLREGYGLANLAKDFGITFNHHDAAEDARATGLILLRALQESGLPLSEWLVKAYERTEGSTQGRITRHGDADGPLAGEVIVFTGALSLPRREAADLAAAAGCEVEGGVTKETTLLVVGDQDIAHLADGQTKSSKHLKAEALIAKGQPIRILCESDFREMIVLEKA